MSDPYDPLFGERERGPAPRRRSPETWARVREAYAAGDSAPELCARFDVGLTALRTRAREEGWRRADAPDPEPLPEDDDADAQPAAPAELRALAWRRMTAAVRRGRVVEANGWMRLVRQLDAVAGLQAASPAQQARAADSLARASAAVAALRPPAPPVAPAPPPTAAPPDPPAAEPPPPPGRSAPPDEPAQPPEAAAVADIPASIPLPAPPDAEIRPPDPHVPHDPHGVSHVRGPVLPSRPPPWVRSALGLR